MVQGAIAGEAPDLLPLEALALPPEDRDRVLLGPVFLPGDVDGAVAPSLAGEVQAPDRVVTEELVQPGALRAGHAAQRRWHPLESGAPLSHLVPRTFIPFIPIFAATF